MNIRTIRRLALGIPLAAVFATGGLNAMSFYSSSVKIPFEFKVGKIVLGAGEYRVEQEFGKDIAYVVNLKTGQRVQMLRWLGEKSEGRTRMTFESKEGVHILKKVS